jgi:hypothetical protein
VALLPPLNRYFSQAYYKKACCKENQVIEYLMMMKREDQLVGKDASNAHYTPDKFKLELAGFVKFSSFLDAGSVRISQVFRFCRLDK